jgi:hypothetical protein
MTRISSAIIILLAICLNACAWMKDNPQSAKLVVQLATMKVIEGGDDIHGRATRVMAIASEASSLFDSQEMSLPALREAIAERLAKENLSPSDQLLVNALVEAVDAELQKRIGQGALNPEQAVQVKAVLDWVIEAAKVYIPAGSV